MILLSGSMGPLKACLEGDRSLSTVGEVVCFYLFIVNWSRIDTIYKASCTFSMFVEQLT